MFTPSARFARQGPIGLANAGGNFTVLGDTQTGYTSWTTERNIAEEFAQFSASGSSGHVVIFRVRVASLPEEQIFQGRDDEAEFLLEGIVEEVSISESAADEEEISND